MADCFGALHFLLLILLIGFSQQQERNDYTVDVAGGHQAYQSSEKPGSSAGLAVDGESSTCTSTEEEQYSWWMVDLGEQRVVTDIYLEAGAALLNYMTIRVGDNNSTANAYCQTYRDGSHNSITLSCIRPMKGRYVVFFSPFEISITLCEVKVFECRDGYFGEECSGRCHCDGGIPCDKETGECVDVGCASGWSGPSCQEECEPGKFGPYCAKTCHCRNNIACSRFTGECPAGQCDDKYIGPTCQTLIPSLANPPTILRKTSTSLTVQWVAWEGQMDPGMQVLYQVQYKVHSFHDENAKWRKLPGDIYHNYDSNYVNVTINNLTVGTNYVVRVIPYLREDRGMRYRGNPSPSSLPMKTRCTAPEPPNIERVDGTVDTSQEKTKAALTVKWKSLEDGQVNCDSIKYYQILYREDNTPTWQEVFASKNTDVKNITSLEFNTVYNVKVVAINNQDFIGASDSLEVVTLARDPSGMYQETSQAGVIAGVIIAIALISALIIAFFLYRKRKNKYFSVPVKEDKVDDLPLNNVVKVEITEDSSPTDLNDSGVVDGSGSEATPSSVADTLESVNNGEDKKKEPPEPVKLLEMPEDCKVIKVEELENYVHERKPNDSEGLRKEYEEIPMGFTTKYDHGKSNENKHKNRFINIIAYDHSRVVLDKTEGDPDSDYINANYIDGYKKPKAYIAAQGCNKYTTQDMWRMVWQVNSNRIIMATNLVENGKRKCDQYWPDEDEKIYDDITVRLVEVEPTSDFIIRTFELTRGEETRNVKQFHFIGWPDHGVPTRAGPIIAFRRKVRAYDESHPGVMVVHCSAGVGRTGTFIALDYLLDKAKEEGIVDVYGLTYQMRRDRVNMIQTVEQYIFVYDALLEALKAGNTAMPCSEFKELYQELCQVDPVKGKSKLQEQYETVQLMSPKVKAEDCKSGALPENMGKNRCPDILPADRHRPYLMIRVDGTNDYINAVFIDGFRKRNAYILTQMPMPHTVIDFWRMVYEHGCASIVMLNPMDENDENYGQYWLEDEACECGPFVIEPNSTDVSNPDITVREMKLTYEPQSPSLMPSKKEEKPRTVSQFMLNCWPRDIEVPNSKTALIQLIELVERWQQKTGDGPIIIHCHNGVTQSGLYAAVSCIWEKMKVDQEVDIFHAVKHLRYHRPQIVNSLEQYQFCFEMVLAYLAEFETYANFR